MTQNKIDWMKPLEDCVGRPARLVSSIGEDRVLTHISLVKAKDGEIVVNTDKDGYRSGVQRIRNVGPKPVTIERWANVYPHETQVLMLSQTYETREEANTACNPLRRIDCVKVSVTYTPKD